MIMADSQKDIEELYRNTDTLRNLITLAEKSGKASIDAGKILFEIRQQEIYKINYKYFASYLKKELNISETKAYSYIRIYEVFNGNQANISPNILVSHLKLLLDLDNTNRNLILGSLANLEIKRDTLFANSEKDEKNFDLRPPYESSDIQALVSIAESVGIDNQQDANKLVTEFIKQKKEEKEFKKKQQINLEEVTQNVQQQNDYDEDSDEPFYYGDDLKSDYFDIADIFRYEPVDEQGLVGMFCSLFHLIKNKPFSFQEKEISFKSIKIIRAAYPDGVVQVRNIGNEKKKYRDLNIEFEFLSSNFIKHKHLEQGTTKCHLIICWENNIRGETEKRYLNKLQAKKVFPKILSIKDLLKTGKIVLQ
jgi:hypothetical protein